MRMRFGAAMPTKGGRCAVVGVEVRESRGADQRLRYEYVVGLVDRVEPQTIEAAVGRLRELSGLFADLRPCVFVDVGSAQGLALRQAMIADWPSALHRPHAFAGTGERVALFAAFLQAYSTGRVRFEAGLAHRAELDQALVFYLGGGAKKDGVELSSEDEALVVALGLALYWPRHGAPADPPVSENAAPGAPASR